MARLKPDRHCTFAWCGEPFTVPSRRGVPPTYCTPTHRQAAYIDRLRHRAGRASTTESRSVAGREHDSLPAQVQALAARVDDLTDQLVELVAALSGRPASSGDRGRGAETGAR